MKGSEFIGFLPAKKDSSFYPDYYQIYAKKNIVVSYANKSYPFKIVPKIIKKGTIGGWINKETKVLGLSWIEKNTFCKDCLIYNSYVESQKIILDSVLRNCVVVANQVVKSSITNGIIFGLAENVFGSEIKIDENSIAYGPNNKISLRNISLTNRTTIMAIEDISIKGNKNKIMIDAGDIRRQDDISSVIEKDVLVASYKALLGGNERRFFVSNSGVFEDRNYNFMCSNISIFELIKSFIEERGCLLPDNKILYSLDKNKNAIFEYLVSDNCKKEFLRETDFEQKTNILLKIVTFILNLDDTVAQTICDDSCIDILNKKIVTIPSELVSALF